MNNSGKKVEGSIICYYIYLIWWLVENNERNEKSSKRDRDRS